MPLESFNLIIFRFFSLSFSGNNIGGLSVVLVVGDTWCAVTDPLRYHSRISYAKSWLLIGAVWICGSVVALASAFRSDCSVISMDVITGAIADVADVYNWIFSSAFFLLIILLPICLVCIMYWKIFTEARQSGQRMRRNGSSPLLQSALNLAHPNGHRGSFGEHNNCASVLDIDALTMKIDGIKETPKIGGSGGDFARHSAKATVPIGTHQYRRYLDIPKAVTDGDKPAEGKATKPSKAKRESRQLAAAALEATRGQSVCRMLSGEMRQVHSTPNLQRFANTEMLPRVDYCANNRSTSNIHSHQQQPHQPHQHQSGTSPKALSYMISIRHRLSNASSIFKYREESRAARISILVVFMLLLSYFPYGMLVLLHGRVIFLANASLLSILFLLIGSMSSPFIFAYRNRRVRRGVCRLFGVDAKPNSYLQKQRMQLRNGIHHAAGNNSKHVRIHRNLSASNISLNLLPCKFTAAAAMLPLHHQYAVHEQLHGITECGDAIGTHFGPIDGGKIDENDEQFSDSEKPNETRNSIKLCDGDINNNNSSGNGILDLSNQTKQEYSVSTADGKKSSFFKRVLTRRSSATAPAPATKTPSASVSIGCENEPVDVWKIAASIANFIIGFEFFPHKWETDCERLTFNWSNLWFCSTTTTTTTTAHMRFSTQYDDAVTHRTIKQYSTTLEFNRIGVVAMSRQIFRWVDGWKQVGCVARRSASIAPLSAEPYKRRRNIVYTRHFSNICWPKFEWWESMIRFTWRINMWRHLIGIPNKMMHLILIAGNFFFLITDCEM